MKKYNEHDLIAPAFAAKWKKRMAELRGDHQGRWPYNDTQGPLLAVLASVEGGDAPPPWVLRALAEAMGEYMKARGDMELEFALLGPVKPRAGNFARRHFAWLRTKHEQFVADRGKTLVRDTLLAPQGTNSKLESWDQWNYFFKDFTDIDAFTRRRLIAWREKYAVVLNRGKPRSKGYKLAKADLEKLLRQLLPRLKLDDKLKGRSKAAMAFLKVTAENTAGK